MQFMKHPLLLASALVPAVANGCCSTVHGAGQDLQKASEKTQDVVKIK